MNERDQRKNAEGYAGVSIMALAKLAPKCRACPKVLTCDHKEMEVSVK